MRLFYIDKAECEHISDITRRVQKIYQLQAELEPYLFVEFLPNKNFEKPGVIIQVGKEIIRKDIDLDKKDEFLKLRNLIWKLIRKYHDPVDIFNHQTGCIDNFKKTQTNNIIQGWKEAKKRLDLDVCCKDIKNIIADGIMEFLILHPVYKYSNNVQIDKNKCKKLRWQECSDNYPKFTPTWNRCIKEVNWLCDNGYSKQNIISEKNKLISKMRKNIYEYLDKNNLKVNKKIFDDIITLGLFDDVGNRMGNKSINIYNINDNLDKIMWEKQHYLKMIENFDNNKIYDLEGAKLSMRGTSLTKYLVLIILIFLILIALIIS